MIRRPPISTRTDTLFPYTTLFRSRIAADTAVFAESFVKLGLVPGDGGAWLLPRVIGMARASLMTLTGERSEEHTSELQSLMRISYAVFCLKKKNQITMTT